MATTTRILTTLLAIALVGQLLPAADAAKERSRKVALLIEGWDCEGCAQGTKKALEKEAGVQQVIARHATGHCFIRFDPDRQSAKKLMAVVRKLGHEVRIDPKAKWP